MGPVGWSLSLLKYIGRVHSSVVARALELPTITHGVTATPQNKNGRVRSDSSPRGYPNMKGVFVLMEHSRPTTRSFPHYAESGNFRAPSKSRAVSSSIKGLEGLLKVHNDVLDVLNPNRHLPRGR